MGVWGWLMEQTPGQGRSRASGPDRILRRGLRGTQEAPTSTSALFLSAHTRGLFVTQPHGRRQKLPSPSEFKRATSQKCLSHDSRWLPQLRSGPTSGHSVSMDKRVLGRRGCCHAGWLGGEESPENPPWVAKSEGAVRPARETRCRKRAPWGAVTAIIGILNGNVCWPLGDVYLSFLVDAPRRPAQPGLCLASTPPHPPHPALCVLKAVLVNQRVVPHTRRIHMCVGGDREVLEMQILEP